jgi:hypothetical protein
MKKPPRLPKPRSLPTKHRAKPKPSAARSGAHSNILDHEYSPETGHLTVTFHGGRKYRYEGVGKGDAEAFAASESKGRHLHSHIIGKFDATKL